MVTTSFNNIYSGKTVLITGHTGFKGSWLSVWLITLGAKIIGLSKDIPTNPSLFESLNIKKHIVHITGDIRDLELLNKILKTYKPEFIFHLAAQSLVLDSYTLPIETFETNVLGTAKLLDACRYCSSVKSILVVTSDKCYENNELNRGYNETDPMGGYDPYSASKGSAELVVNAFRNSYFNVNDFGKTHQTSIASARAGNVIGGGDWAKNRLVPDCVKSLINKAPVTIRRPESIRPWQFVLEPLSGYLLLAAKQFTDGTKFSGGWNFGPEETESITVESLVQKIISLWGKGYYNIEQNIEMHEAGLLKLDISKAVHFLSWHSVFDIQSSLQKTIEWYLNFYSENQNNVFDFSLNQIDYYIKQAQFKNINWAKT